MTDNMATDNGEDLPKPVPEDGPGGDDSSSAKAEAAPPKISPETAAMLAAAMGGRKVQPPETGERGEADDEDEQQRILSPEEIFAQNEAENAREQRGGAPDKEAEWEAALIERLGESVDEKDDVDIFRQLQIPPGKASAEILRKIGRSEEHIDHVMQSGELAPDFTPEERLSPPDTDIEARTEELDTKIEEFQDIQEKVESRAMPEKADIVKIEEAKKGLNRFLFDEGVGLLRKGERVRRLLLKPGAAGLLAALISYALLVHAATKWAVGRVGK